jgi:transmembrane sensor
MSAERITTLFTRYMDGNATEAERLELSALALMAENTVQIKRLEQEYWENMKETEDDMTEEVVEKLMHSITLSKSAIVKLLLWRRIAIAASIIILLGVGTYFVFFNKKMKQDEIVETNEPTRDVEAPKRTKAIITLADGRQISIDSLNMLTQGNVQVSKTKDGKIIYNGSENKVIYNTLTNPRGSKVVDMTLTDGSHVWLNASSSITYPISFVGSARKVSVTGEAYFEIAHNPSMPFTVSKGNTDVQVLGTEFNVNAYDDEADIKVTLLKGSVKVKVGNATSALTPGQQARISNDIKIVNGADLEQVMAWKNGNFKFTRTDLKVIMRDIGRWYDVEVSYEGNIPVQLYNVGVPRTANISEVLKGLEYTGAHFSVEGRKIIVRP